MILRPRPVGCTARRSKPGPSSVTASSICPPSARSCTRHAARMAVAQRVAERLLHDAIEVRRGVVVEALFLGQRRCRCTTSTPWRSKICVARASSASAQAVVRRGHGREAARQRARGIDGVVDQRHDLLDVAAQLRGPRAREPRHQALEQQRDAGELLAEAVVQVRADALLLARGDLQHLALEPLALGDVAEHGDDAPLAADVDRREDAGRRPGVSPSARRPSNSACGASPASRSCSTRRSRRSNAGARPRRELAELAADEPVRRIAEQRVHRRIREQHAAARGPAARRPRGSWR